MGDAVPTHSTTDDSSSAAASAAWSALPRWMREPLEAAPLHYDTFLPVQAIVVPYVLRAIRSHMPMDVCLSAPTGSGKTLCYLIPILHMIGAEKRELNDTRLRAVILVPTKALGAQVHAVAKRMTAGTTISVACACGEHPTKEAGALVRRVNLIGELSDSDAEDDDANDDVVPATAEDEDLEEAMHHAMQRQRKIGGSSSSLFFSDVDILIVTPQRLLKHCGSTPGFSLKYLRMLVIDEADQILASGANGTGGGSSNFTNLVGRIIRLCEPVANASVSSSASTSSPILHKVLCSATLSTHITRISEVRLRNAKHFSLTTDGQPLEGVDARVVQASTGAMSHFSSKFALPPKLVEHMLTTTDEHRPALLLKLVKHIMDDTPAVAAVAAKQQQDAPNSNDEELEEGAPPVATVLADDEAAATSPPGDVPSAARSAAATCGRTCVVFCAQSDTARVLSKFLSSCGIAAMDFTSASSVAERRHFVISGVSGRPVVLVTTDALMRGVDLPGVGHVVMYDAPQSLPQFVHRVGRTARALRTGHAYLLLTKKGPSGTLTDGEVAKYKALGSYLTRSQPPVYEQTLQVLSEEDIAVASTKLQETRARLEAVFAISAPPARVANKDASASNATKTAVVASKTGQEEDGAKKSKKRQRAVTKEEATVKA